MLVLQAVAALESRRIKMETKSGGHHGSHHRELNISEEGEQSEDDSSSTEEGGARSHGLRHGATQDETSRFFAVAWALEILRWKKIVFGASLYH